MTDQMPRLEGWYIAPYSPYAAPEAAYKTLMGYVYNHPGRADGEYIRTSAVQELNLKAGTATTLSRTYQLGEPDKSWLMWLEVKGYGKINEFLDRETSDSQVRDERR